MRPNVMFDRLRRGGVLIGLCVMYPASGIIECMSKGWDFVWIDSQHGQIAYADALHCLQAATGQGLETLLRVPGHEPGLMAPLADLGPSAVMVPMVNNKAQADAVVQALRFPPLGMRSYGGRRVIDLDGREFYKERELLVVAQTETVQAVENAGQIIETEGIDMLFFSPDDMKAQMGLPINTAVTESDRLRDAMAKTADAARRAGKFAGCVGANAASAKMAAEMGYQLLIGGADAGFLRVAAAEKLAEVRGAVSGTTAKPPVSKGGNTLYG